MKRKLLPLRGFQFYLTWSQDDKKDHDQSRKIKKEGPSLKKKKKKKKQKNMRAGILEIHKPMIMRTRPVRFCSPRNLCPRIFSPLALLAFVTVSSGSMALNDAWRRGRNGIPPLCHTGL